MLRACIVIGSQSEPEDEQLNRFSCVVFLAGICGISCDQVQEWTGADFVSVDIDRRSVLL